jgi:glucose/arabinose dehydrogenase
MRSSAKLVVLAVLGAALAASCASAQPAARHASRAAAGFRAVASGLSNPVYVTAPANQPRTIYVVEKTGKVIVFVNGKRRAQPFLDLTGQVSGASEQGLLSLAFGPTYAKTHLVYVDYTDRNGDTRVVRFKTNGTAVVPSTRKQLLFVKQPFDNHNGGEVAFGPDGRLYVGMGDGGSGGDPGNRAQNLSVRLGKLLRLTPRGWQIAAYGLRNPWRYSWDRLTKTLVVADVGQNEWEEVDVLPRGSGVVNLGWSVYEGRVKFKSEALRGSGKLVFPSYVYSHSTGGCSITGGYVYRGSAVPSARGRYFFGDYCSGKIWSAKLSGRSLTGVTQVGHLGGGLSSFGEDARGELYATTLDGKVYRLS